MFDVGFSELILLIIVAIIVLGPNKASEAINYIIQARRKLSHFKSELTHEMGNIKKLEEKLYEYLNYMENKDKEENIKYYPIDHFQFKAPFNTVFVLEHLMLWNCFKI
jgi:sec-independent protein translocase protein TatB